VKDYIGAMDYAGLCESTAAINVDLEGVAVTLQRGVHFFASLTDKLAAEPDASLAWTLV
jgi:hypothetical protein